GFIAGNVLLSRHRWGPRLPFGAFALVLGLNALMLGAARDQLLLVPGAVVAGLAADALVRALSPSPARPAALRAVAFGVPAIYFALFFTGIELTRGIWWAIPICTGTIGLAVPVD